MLFVSDIEELTEHNTDFRRVLQTGQYAQAVVMSLPPGVDIGLETHDHTDQLFLVIDGKGEATVGDETQSIGEGDFLFVSAGSAHNIRAGSGEDLKLLTIYAPPIHPDGAVYHTKADARAA